MVAALADLPLMIAFQPDQTSPLDIVATRIRCPAAS